MTQALIKKHDMLLFIVFINIYLMSLLNKVTMVVN